MIPATPGAAEARTISSTRDADKTDPLADGAQAPALTTQFADHPVAFGVILCHATPFAASKRIHAVLVGVHPRIQALNLRF